MASPKDDLRERAASIYRDDDITAMVIDDAEEHGTIERILDGELTLPGKFDAQNHFNRLRGVTTMTPRESQQELTIRELEKRLRIVEQNTGASPPAMGGNSTQS